MNPIALHDSGDAVQDVQHRLFALGYDLGPTGIDGRFGPFTSDAVHAFRGDEHLDGDDVIDDAAWEVLVDATYISGDRTLYLRLPNFHGRDVRDMQRALTVLGFAAGPIDGIFDATTETAVREFQRNIGVPPDGIAGPWTFDAITRLRHSWEGKEATPHSGAVASFARAAQVVEHKKVCFYGIDTTTRDIAMRIANLASATTLASLVTSADVCTVVPDDDTLLIEITTTEGTGDHIPFITFIEGASLAPRILTAIRTTDTKPPRIAVGLPSDVDGGFTMRVRQHLAVALLDALCGALD